MEKKQKPKIPLPLKFIRWGFPLLEKTAPGLARKLAAKLFFMPIRFPSPQQEKETMKKGSHFWVSTEGKKVACHVFGEGRPVLMVHGWSGRGGQFYKFIERFTKTGFQVITFDAPGHGHSSGSSTSVLEFADVIIQLDTKFKPELIIGHSLGGVAGLFASVNHRLNAGKLIMIGSPTIAEDVLSEFMRMTNGSIKSAEGINDYVIKKTGKPFAHFFALHIINKVRDLELQLIYDEDDKQAPVSHGEALAAAYPRARLIKTKGLGHTRILRSMEVVDMCLETMTEPVG